ncbi:MurR/RpiR family transcriptional regulator [Blastococcus sp. VKM Ac-2987]|uniref:MurR/RpiR family transcriptional regulator n=1 Tax=Blastococcus sp. VKM Ac-2987 TaxID=3004141 RepID=UPI0022AB8226|nr:MurR/RpiR family transcriptional regulator [Blastococcus sp. VKM Ac-2987]MCZ2860768.1 MurR/RpiR family transcriptional regulator [Blastococcus sp. VKM Ac-2987]
MTGLRIDERIGHCHPALTAQERRAAETLLEHLDDLATYRAAELAVLAGVSKATMSRLFRSLGFSDFDEVRDHLRSLRTAGEPRRVAGPPDLAEHAGAEAGAVATAVLEPAVAAAVAVLADARQVLVVGWRNSHPVALHLREQLVQARPRVHLAPLPGQVLGEELADLGPGDAVVAVGFRRRPAGFAGFLTTASATGADVVLLGDPTAAGHAGSARVWLPCPVQGTLAYDSYAAAMSVVAVLADGVLSRVGRAGRDRISTISATYTLLGEVE